VKQLPQNVRLATPTELERREMFRTPVRGEPTIVGEGKWDGYCPQCGSLVVKSLHPGYFIQANIECSNCQAILRLAY
jgi:hypothetical protein